MSWAENTCYLTWTVLSLFLLFSHSDTKLLTVLQLQCLQSLSIIYRCLLQCQLDLDQGFSKCEAVGVPSDKFLPPTLNASGLDDYLNLPPGRETITSASVASSSQPDTYDQQDNQDENSYPQQEPHPPVDELEVVCGRHSSCKRQTLSWNMFTIMSICYQNVYSIKPMCVHNSP